MTTKTPVPITGSVLAWARDEAGLSLEELAARVGVPPMELSLWEQEADRPGKSQFKKIVTTLQRPSAIFFMPSPPLQSAMPTAFRRSAVSERQVSSPALRQIRRARRIQHALSWLREQEGDTIRRWPRYDWRTAAAVDAAATFRAELGLSFTEQLGWPNVRTALGTWRGALEDHGILVFSLQLGRDDIRGFSAWDEWAPLIATNTAYVPGARIFTLGHEVGHLLTRSDAACLDWIRPSARPDRQLERWCEEFAANLLLPTGEFRNFVQREFGFTRDARVTAYVDVQTISHQVKASARATALALIRAGLADNSLYAVVDSQATAGDFPGRSGGGGEPIVPKRLGQYGRQVSGSLLDALDSGRLDPLDVTDYLGITLNDLVDLRLELNRGRGA